MSFYLQKLFLGWCMSVGWQENGGLHRELVGSIGGVDIWKRSKYEECRNHSMLWRFLLEYFDMRENVYDTYSPSFSVGRIGDKVCAWRWADCLKRWRVWLLRNYFRVGICCHQSNLLQLIFWYILRLDGSIRHYTVLVGGQLRTQYSSLLKCGPSWGSLT